MKKYIFPALLALLLILQVILTVSGTKDKPESGNPDEGTPPFPPLVVTQTDATEPSAAVPSEPTQQTSQTDAPVEVDLTQYAVAAYSDVKFRKSDSGNSTLLGYLQKGEQVILLERGSDWCKVDRGGTIGWVQRSKLDIIRNKALEAQQYPPIPAVQTGQIHDIAGTATAMYLSEVAGSYDTTGLSMAVFKNGQVAYHYEYGFSDHKKTAPVTQKTKFRVASISKVFTSMLAMKLDEDGKLDIDADLNTILDYKVRNPHYKNEIITTRMLLSHTSSFVDKSPMYSSSVVYDVENKDSYSWNKPGTSFSYCNFGMGLAGAVIEKGANMNLSKYAQQAFLTPMGIDAAYDGAYLKDTSDVADCIEFGKVSRSAAKIVEPKTERDLGYTVTLSAGGLLINSVDMARIISILACNGQYGGVQYLSPKTIEEMHTTQITTKVHEQCIGVRKSDTLIPGRTVYYHTGCSYGIFSLIIYDPVDQSGAVIIATGADDYSDDYGIRRVCSDSLEYIYEDLIDG